VFASAEEVDGFGVKYKIHRTVFDMLFNKLNEIKIWCDHLLPGNLLYFWVHHS